MNEILDHINSVSMFGRSAAALFLVLGSTSQLPACIPLRSGRARRTAVAQFWCDRRSLRAKQRRLPGLHGRADPCTMGACARGHCRLASSCRVLGAKRSAAALGALIGARLSDTAISHVALHAAERPIPDCPRHRSMSPRRSSSSSPSRRDWRATRPQQSAASSWELWLLSLCCRCCGCCGWWCRPGGEPAGYAGSRFRHGRRE